MIIEKIIARTEEGEEVTVTKSTEEIDATTLLEKSSILGLPSYSYKGVHLNLNGNVLKSPDGEIVLFL